MKLMIINPDWGMTKEQMAARCRLLSRYVSSDVTLSMECLEETRVSLESSADIVLAGPEILKIARRAQEREYDGIILYCFSDPALEACRQAVSVPVVGAGQAACLMVPAVGYQAAILLADVRRIPEKLASLSRTGLSADRICGFEAICSRGLDPFTHREYLREELLAAGRRALDKTGAQVLVLGCLSFLGLAQELERELHVPVIDPGPAGVALAEALVRQGLRSSKRAYLDETDMSCIP